MEGHDQGPPRDGPSAVKATPAMGERYGSSAGLDGLPASNVVGPHGAMDPGPDSDGPHPFETDEADRYRDPQLIALGGMGRVSAVTDARLRRQVARKEVIPDASAGALQGRLAQEAWITAQLEHPGIVPIYNVGKDPDGRLFFTMRLIRGRSLATALSDGDLDAGTLMRHFLNVCQAMAYAHAMGVVHRDLKPSNIMLGEFGETQIVDWGVARPIGADDTASVAVESVASSVPEELAVQTMIGARVGTPAYMSPEQAKAQPLSRASDVWSLGLVLFEIVAGRSLYDGLTTKEIFKRLDQGPLPRVTDVVPDAPPELVSIIDRALARTPADRYASAQQLAADVAAYLDGQRVAAHTYSTWDLAKRFYGTFRAPLLVAAAALLVVGTVGTLTYLQTLHERDLAVSAEAAATTARDRALAAEAATASALSQADRSFAAVLVQRAQEAQRRGTQAEAEVLAANALTRIDSPQARGVLAAYSAGPRVSLVEVAVAPDCISGLLSPSTRRLLCRELDGISVWGLSPRVHEATLPGTLANLVFVSDIYAFAASANADLTPIDVAQAVTLPPHDFGPGPNGVGAAGVGLVHNSNELIRWDSATDALTHISAPIRDPWAISGDGTVAITFSQDQKTPWRVDLKAAVARPSWALPFVDDEGPISVGLDHTGKRAAFGGTKGDLVVTELETGRLLWRQRMTDRSLTDLQWSPDGRWLSIRDERGWTSVIRSDGAARMPLPRLHMTSVRWRPTQTRRAELVTVGQEIRVYRMPDPDTLPATSYLATAGIASLSLDVAGERIALPDGRGTTRVYSVSDGTLQSELRRDTPLVAKSAVFLHAPAGTLAVSYPAEGSLTLWDPATGKVDTSANNTSLTYRRVVSAWNGWLFCAHYGPMVRYGAPPKPGLEMIPADGTAVSDLVASLDGRVVAYLTERGAVELFDVGSDGVGAPRLVLQWPGANDIALDGTGARIAIATLGRVDVLDVASRSVLRRYTVPGQRIRPVALSADGQQVAVGTIDGEVMVWNKHGDLAMIGGGHDERVSGVVFDPAGRWLISSGWDGVARRWDLSKLDADPARLLATLDAQWGIGLDHVMTADLR